MKYSSLKTLTPLGLCMLGLCMLGLGTLSGCGEDAPRARQDSGPPPLPVQTCATAEPMMADGAPANGFVATGYLSGDTYEGTCTQGKGGHDAVVLFTPPSTGGWSFSAEDDTGEPLVVYARRRCEDAQEQLGCDTSLSVWLEADVAVSLVIDGPDALRETPFSVRAVSVSAPELTDGQLFVNSSVETLGLLVRGTSPSAVSALGLSVFDADGQPVPLTQDGSPLRLAFDRLSQDPQTGVFEGWVSRSFMGASGLGSAQVFVTDSEQRLSATLSLTPQAPGVAGERCDPRRALDVCAEGQLCARRGCMVVPSECPADWTVRDLSAAAGWRLDGDTSGEVPRGTATCGGGSPAQVFRFVAPAPGPYRFVMDSRGHPDTLLFVRSTCDSPDILAERACNDDATEGDLFQSAVTVRLEADEAVYVFADGYATEDPLAGAFVISAAAVSAPVVESGEGSINRSARTLGARLQGVDAEDDIVFAFVELRTADDTAIPLARDGAPVAVGFDRLIQGEGRFELSLSLAFAEDFGGFDRAARLVVWLVDAAELLAEPVAVELEAAGDLDSGARCDLQAAFGDCPVGEACANLGTASSPPTCQAPAVACPAEWPVRDVHSQPDWTVRGDTGEVAGAIGAQQGSCGGAGLEAVLRFVAPVAGRFAAEVTGAGDGRDSVLYARSECGFSQPRFELACNDDLDETNVLSRIEFTARAGQPIFLFVDSYGSTPLGSFTVVVSAL